MRTSLRRFGASALLFSLGARPASAQALTRTEQQLRTWISAHREDQIALLERMVNIPSGSLNVAGVRAVGDSGLATSVVRQDAGTIRGIRMPLTSMTAKAERCSP